MTDDLFRNGDLVAVNLSSHSCHGELGLVVDHLEGWVAVMFKGDRANAHWLLDDYVDAVVE